MADYTKSICVPVVLRVFCSTGWLNTIAPYILAPLYGVPPGTYRLHHVIMHHVEDNTHGWDLSATEGYQRDSLAHFARCAWV
jgi:fatty acid desaturase